MSIGKKSEDSVQIAVANFYDTDGIVLHPQGADVGDSVIDAALSAASKNATGRRGRPDFIGKIARLPGALLVIENKADVAHHVSGGIDGKAMLKEKDLRQPQKFACDGALHYAKFLSPHFDVIALGVSGIGKDGKIARADYYYRIKGAETCIRINTDGKSLLPPQQLIRAFQSAPEISRHRIDHLGQKSGALAQALAQIGFHNNTRAQFFGMLLIALGDRDFCEMIQGGNEPSAADLLRRMQQCILRRFDNKHEAYDIAQKQIEAVTSAISHRLTDSRADYQTLLDCMREIADIRASILHSGAADALGAFYTSFMSKMPGGESDKKDFGIILTPHHVTDMFPQIAAVNPKDDSVLVDTCCGTAAFLMSVLRYLDRQDAPPPPQFINRNLIGIEKNEVMYLLSCFNMILKGGDASNIIFGDSFAPRFQQIISAKQANFAFLNPPYSVRRDDGGLDYERHELRFVINACQLLRRGGKTLALIPTNSVDNSDQRVNQIKRELLQQHTVDAVFKLSKTTFDGIANVETCIIVCAAGIPHPPGQPVYLGNWEDDGMVFARGIGATDKNGQHDQRMANYVADYHNRAERDGAAILAAVGHDDEWTYQSKLAPSIEKRQFAPPDSFRIARHILNYAASRVRLGEVDALNHIRSQAIAAAPPAALSAADCALFSLDDIFALSKGKRHHVNQAQIDFSDYPEPGRIPYVSSSEIEEKQGLNGYIRQSDVGAPTHAGRYLTLNYGGGNLHCFYREGVAYCTDSLNVAHIKNTPDTLDVFIGAYLKELIMRYKPCFSYNSAPSLARIRNLKIALPVQADGGVNWPHLSACAKAAFAQHFGQQ